MKVRLDAILDQAWALEPAVLHQVGAFLSGDTSVRAAITRTPAQPRTQWYISVIPIHGIIEHRSSLLAELFGGTSVEGIRAAFRAAIADPDVRGVVLSVDSPGGGVAGVTELAAEIRAARGTKPIVAIADTVAGSAAYWLASQADTLLVTPSGKVGSVGIYAVHQEASRLLDAEGITTTVISAGEHKFEGNEFEPLTDDARAAIQKQVDSFYELFVNDVAKGRGVSAEKVRADYGKGRTMLPREALAAGMVDGIDTLEGALRRVSRSARGSVSAEAGEVEPIALDDEPRPFSERVAMLEADARAVMEHGLVRAALRAKEGRPAFSDPTFAALRSIRDAMSALLSDEPTEAPPAADPPPVVVPVPAPAVPVAPRFRSQDEWLQFLQETTA